jgi:hypothetical protein
MTHHIFYPYLDFDKHTLTNDYSEWLSSKLSEYEENIENGDISSSMCLQGVFIELLLDNRPRRNWIEIMDEYLLTDDKIPMAYSEIYGERLFKFNFWNQSSIHAIHTRWWIEGIFNVPASQRKRHSAIIEKYIQPTGWIYNPQISETNPRTRMKSELMMSLLMGLEILKTHEKLSPYRERFQATLSSCPFTHYIGAEFFRLLSLEVLDSTHLRPREIPHVVTSSDSISGFCDFALEDKVDDYMGTAKRTARDKIISSPYSSLQVLYLTSNSEREIKDAVAEKMKKYAQFLNRTPFEIPAFRIRDIDIPFGTGISPIEVIAASVIRKLCI